MATRRKVLREGTRKKIEYFDYNLLAVLIFIICFGLIMLYSASAYNSQAANNGDGMYLFRRQAMVTAGSFVVMLVRLITISMPRLQKSFIIFRFF